MFQADRGSSGYRWPVLRMTAGSHTRVTLLSVKFFELTTHYVGCTVPCCGDGCELCDLLPSRGLFYLAVNCQQRVSILELGGQSAMKLEQHMKFMHSGLLAGHVIDLTRRGKKSPVYGEVVETLPGVAAVTHLELVQRVMALYKFPPPNPSETFEAYERRCAALAITRCKRLVERVRKGEVGRV